jgi:hypothetical protein
LPGILNIEKELNRQRKEKLDQDKNATLVIQKWARGLLGRLKVKKMRLLKEK